MNDILITLTRYNKLWAALGAAGAVAVTTALTNSPDSFGPVQVIQITLALLAAIGVYVSNNTKSQPLAKFIVQLLAVIGSFLVSLEGGLTRSEIYTLITTVMGAYLVYTVGNRPSEDIDHTHVDELANREVPDTTVAQPQPLVATIADERPVKQPVEVDAFSSLYDTP